MNFQQVYTEDYYRIRAYEDSNLWQHFSLMAHAIQQHLGPQVTLDVGCARGYFVQAMRACGIQGYGMDVSSYALANCADGMRNYLRQADANEELPFFNASFDVVTCMECLEHLTNPRGAIAEMARVLRRGGYVVASSPRLSVWHWAFNLVFGQAEVHPSELSLAEWRRLFAEQGFTYVGDYAVDWDIADELHRMTVGRTYKMIPCTSVGRAMNRLGALGRWLRVWLNVKVWQSEHMLFRLERRVV